MVDDLRWMATVHWMRPTAGSERHALEGDPAFIWEQCGVWLADETIKTLVIERTTVK